MEYEEVAKAYVIAKMREMQDNNKALGWLMEFALKDKKEQKPEIKDWLKNMKKKLRADKASLESRKIEAEEALDREIVKMDSAKVD